MFAFLYDIEAPESMCVSVIGCHFALVRLHDRGTEDVLKGFLDVQFFFSDGSHAFARALEAFFSVSS